MLDLPPYLRNRRVSIGCAETAALVLIRIFMLKSSQAVRVRANRPSRQIVRRWCVAAATASFFYSALASALGLGDITLHSALEQPFNADIELVDTAGLGAEDIHVGLASAEAFSRAGVDRLF